LTKYSPLLPPLPQKKIPARKAGRDCHPKNVSDMPTDIFFGAQGLQRGRLSFCARGQVTANLFINSGFFAFDAMTHALVWEVRTDSSIRKI
jgi:hypothetical protein